MSFEKMSQSSAKAIISANVEKDAFASETSRRVSSVSGVYGMRPRTSGFICIHMIRSFTSLSIISIRFLQKGATKQTIVGIACSYMEVHFMGERGAGGAQVIEFQLNPAQNKTRLWKRNNKVSAV